MCSLFSCDAPYLEMPVLPLCSIDLINSVPSLTAVHVAVISLAIVIRCFSVLALRSEAQEASSGTSIVPGIFLVLS